MDTINVDDLASVAECQTALAGLGAAVLAHKIAVARLEYYLPHYPYGDVKSSADNLRTAIYRRAGELAMAELDAEDEAEVG